MKNECQMEIDFLLERGRVYVFVSREDSFGLFFKTSISTFSEFIDWVDVALLESSLSHLQEFNLLLKIFDSGGSGIAHTTLDSLDELIQDSLQRTGVGDISLDTLGSEFSCIGICFTSSFSLWNIGSKSSHASVDLLDFSFSIDNLEMEIKDWSIGWLRQQKRITYYSYSLKIFLYFFIWNC